MDMSTATPGDASHCIRQLEIRIEAAAATIENLQKMSDLTAGSASGDPYFDVEFTLALNIAQAALLRFKALLAEQSGKLTYELEDVLL